MRFLLIRATTRITAGNEFIAQNQFSVSNNGELRDGRLCRVANGHTLHCQP